MAKLVTTAQMRSLEHAAIEAGTPERELMRRAGVALAEHAWTAAHRDRTATCLVLVGPGNNGGDGLVAARHLHELGATVEVYLLRPRADDDAEWAAVREAEIPTTLADNDPGLSRLGDVLLRARVVVDAVFGIGFHPTERPITGVTAAALARLAAAHALAAAPSSFIAWSPRRRASMLIAARPTGSRWRQTSP